MRTDFTGIAYLTALGLAGVAAWAVYRKSSGLTAAAADLVGTVSSGVSTALDAVNPASSTNLASRGADATVSALAGRDTSIGSLVADVFPSAAERAVNDSFRNQVPNYLDPVAPGIARFDFWDTEESDAPAFGAYVGVTPADLSKPAIIYRAPRRLQ